MRVCVRTVCSSWILAPFLEYLHPANLFVRLMRRGWERHGTTLLCIPSICTLITGRLRLIRDRYKFLCLFFLHKTHHITFFICFLQHNNPLYVTPETEYKNPIAKANWKRQKLPDTDQDSDL